MSLEHLKIKSADLVAVLPTALPAVGGLIGKTIGHKYIRPIGNITGAEIGTVLGATSGGVGGQLIKDYAEPKQDAPQLVAIPPGAPYDLDPTTTDIPDWALQGARLLRPYMKQAGHLGPIVGEDVLGAAYPVVKGVQQGQSGSQIARNVAGQVGGTLAGSLIGHGIGALADTAARRVLRKPKSYQLPGIMGVPLSDLLAGLGATIGNVRGLAAARG